MNKQRQAQLAWWSCVIALVCIAALVFRGLAANAETLRACTPLEPPAVEDWRPPIRNCPDDVELWECMRHAMWRTDL